MIMPNSSIAGHELKQNSIQRYATKAMYYICNILYIHIYVDIYNTHNFTNFSTRKKLLSPLS